MNLFGFWRSPLEIPIGSDRLYRIRARISTDLVDPTRVPEFRLRVNTENEWAAQVFIVDSWGSAANVPVPGGNEYDFHFYPPQDASGGTMYLSFDMVNFGGVDAAEATLSLESITVESFALP